MYKTKLCLGLSSSFSLPYEQQIRTLRQIGFEGFFTAFVHAVVKHAFTCFNTRFAGDTPR